ncbi:MAG: ribosomal protein L11 [Methylocystaceae bacterium]|nr:MAG: ribosomal protein L11 [Methylocystaceae bacterium]
MKIPIPTDMAAERRGVYRQAALAFPFCAVILGAAVWWLPRRIEFPIETGERLAFAARAILLIVFCLLIAVGIVSTLRRYAESRDITGSAYGPPSDRLKVPIAFLQNTHEQVTMAAFAILALATVPGDAPLAFIMASVPLFAIGRFTFLRGYPHGAAARAFGMVTTGVPILGAFAWVIYDMIAGLLRGTI